MKTKTRRPYIESVVITWCAKDGTRKSMPVDMKKASGILWRKPDKKQSAVMIEPRTAMQPFPRRREASVRKAMSIPSATAIEAESPAESPSDDPESTCCWWDGYKWICPAEPEP
jgi:hypothetical protein